MNEFSSWYSTWCSTKFLSQKWSSTHKLHIDVFITFMCISCILCFWQWYITWCFVFTFSIKIIFCILRMSYLMSCEFLSGKNCSTHQPPQPHIYTAPSCSLLFTFCPRYSTRFLVFIKLKCKKSFFKNCCSAWLRLKLNTDP